MRRVRGSLQSPRRATGNRSWAAAVGVLAITLMVGDWRAAGAERGVAGRPDPFKASTSRETRDDAIRSIPFDKLDPTAQAAVRSVLSNVTMFRRMPVRVIQCDPSMYLFLLQNPHIVVNIWQVFGITQISLDPIAPETYRLTDTGGTDGTVRFLYRSHDTHLIYADGVYEGPLSAKPTRGRGLLVLKTGYLRGSDGRYYITARLDTFMQVEPGGVELLTKTFQPLVGKIADLNFVQTAAFVGSLSKTAEVNPEGMHRLASKLSKVEPELRDQLAQLADEVSQKALGLPLPSDDDDEPLVAHAPRETSPK